MPGNNTRFTLPDWIYHLSFEEALKLLLLYFTGGTVPPASGGGGITPPTVNGVQVVGIAEHRTYQNALSTASTTIPAGALSLTVPFSSDFVGTIGGIAYAGATQAAYSDSAQPGNVLPSIPITRSAGTYSIITATPT